eukprot:5341831-Pleurochrysis_carterae.AAC.2
MFKHDSSCGPLVTCSQERLLLSIQHARAQACAPARVRRICERSKCKHGFHSIKKLPERTSSTQRYSGGGKCRLKAAA